MEIESNRSKVSRTIYREIREIPKDTDIKEFTDRLGYIIHSIMNIFNDNQYSISYYNKGNTRHFAIAFINEDNILETAWLYRKIQ